MELDATQNTRTAVEQVAAADPALEYSRRLSQRESELQNLQRRHIWTGNLRVAVFVAILVLCWKIGRTGLPSLYWLAAAVLLFIALVALHRRILRAKSLAERAANLYRRGLARIEDRWAGTGDTGEQFAVPDHLYAEDLDILGQGSLFQLLCVARSRMGKACLADWLLNQAAVSEIRERQAAVLELSQKSSLREDLALAGESDDIKADPIKLKHWAAASVALDYRRWWPWALILAAVNVVTFSYALESFFRRGAAFWTPFLLALVINGTIMFVLRHRLQHLFAGLDDACHNLDALASVLRRIEIESFSSPRLQALQRQLLTNGVAASHAIRQLDTLCDLENSRHNMIVRFINLPLLYSLQVALALQRWREKYSNHVVGWLEAVGELEALLSLATYAFEHPHDPLPEFSDEPAQLQAKGLGHPLLASDRCVRNDVSLGGHSQVLLVSGSNMSGKSTLLRAVGVNAVLAMMGAPVRAQCLRLSPVTVGASMRLSDSLQKGVSHFYAEISRIRQVVDLSAAGPLLFLFDEILQGTNSHDRRVGAQGILHTLIRNGAIGLITTHDLALTSLTDVIPGTVMNVHFQETLESGKLSFDYCLRPGVVTTSNGVELMKSIGLKV